MKRFDGKPTEPQRPDSCDNGSCPRDGQVPYRGRRYCVRCYTQVQRPEDRMDVHQLVEERIESHPLVDPAESEDDIPF